MQSAVLAFPRRVIVASLVMVAAALALGAGVEFRTSRGELAPPDDPDQIRFEALRRQFLGATALIAAIEEAPGLDPDPDRLRAHADALAHEFASDPMVEQVFHRVDLEWILERGLYLAPPAAIEAAAGLLEGDPALIESLAAVRDLADLNELIAARIEADVARAALPEADAAAGIGRLADLLRAERRFIETPLAVASGLERQPPLLTLAGADLRLRSRGYLATGDGRTLYLIITRRDLDDSLPALRTFVGAMRRRAEGLAERRPGFRVAFTGEPATTVEEMGIVRRDTWRTTIVALLGVSTLALLVFRWKMHAVLLLAALAVGLAWSFGAVRLEIGYLNVITSSFLSTLIGVGIAYGIHPISEYELEGAHTSDPIGAIRGAYHLTGAAVTVSAVTTAAAFFAVTQMEFRGFSELGLVAGVGVILCLIATLLTLPALLAVYGLRRHRRDRAGRAAPPTAAVDLLWDRHGAPLVCRFPRTVTAASLLLTAVFGWTARDIGFDINILELLPGDAESVRSQKRMVMESNLSPAFNVVVADDLDGLRALRERAAREPAIDRIESVLMFLPEEPERSAAAIDRLRALLDRVRLPQSARPLDRERCLASARRLQSAVEQAAEAAFAAGLGDLAGPLETARGETESLIAAIEKAPAGAEADWSAAQQALLAWAGGALEAVRRAAAADPPAADSLPASLRERFFSQDGRPLAFLQPAENVFETAFLEEYTAASRRVSPEAAGFPIMLHTMAHNITSGFYAALVIGGILVVLILLVDYRNLRDVALAILPLGVGMVWMLGAMRLVGLQFNFANLVAVPLIVGVGIDNGVHVVHRMRYEGERGMTEVLRHTGRAIIIAGLTTMTGFGSLALASHRGLASLGLSLLIGVGACVTTAIVVLPNVLVAAGWAKR
jgi:predicted RND superfamily exporter protein